MTNPEQAPAVDLTSARRIIQAFSGACGVDCHLIAASGETLGISVEDRAGQYGPYQVVLYDQGAQRFIVDNVDAIMAFAAGKDTRA